jgi:flagellar hook assembly protein FlgD
VGVNFFNPAAGGVGEILMTLSRAQHVSVSIFNRVGKKVRQIDQNFSSGPQTLNWDGRGDGGEALSAGVYILRVDKEADADQTLKMILAK